jgi:hypothetical protein
VTSARIRDENVTGVPSGVPPEKFLGVGAGDGSEMICLRRCRNLMSKMSGIGG